MVNAITVLIVLASPVWGIFRGGEAANAYTKRLAYSFLPEEIDQQIKETNKLIETVSKDSDNFKYLEVRRQDLRHRKKTLHFFSVGMDEGEYTELNDAFYELEVGITLKWGHSNDREQHIREKKRMKELNDQIRAILSSYAETTLERHQAKRELDVERVRELRARVSKSRDREEIKRMREELDRLYHNRPRMSVHEKRERAARRRQAKLKRRQYSASALEKVGVIRHQIARAEKNGDFIQLRRLERKLQQIDKDPTEYTDVPPPQTPRNY